MLAVNRVTKTDDGQKRDEVNFIDVVLRGRLAEVAQQYLKKGRPAFVEGPGYKWMAAMTSRPDRSVIGRASLPKVSSSSERNPRRKSNHLRRRRESINPASAASAPK
jgi:single-stranded DNA-binding protein